MRIRPRGQIRSHRALKHKIVAPWIVATLVTTLVIVAASAGFYQLLRRPCGGELTATVVASPSTASLLETLARTWLEEEPVVNGRCASVGIETKDAPTIVEALGQRWNTKTNGPAPDAWVPDSSLWVRQAAVNTVVARMLPPEQPSLARSVAVIAMPKPMAEAVGWPKTQLTWSTLVTDVAPAGWTRYGKPNWGPFRIGMTDPTKSTTGLLTLASIASPDANGRPPSQGVATINRLKQTRSFLATSTDEILVELSKADQQGADAVFGYVSAFPALETDVITYNQTNPTVPLIAVYPSNGSFDADNPGLVLRAEWTNNDKSQVAAAFLTYARGAKGHSAFVDAAYRDSSRAATRDITEDNGVTPKVATPPRATPEPDAVAKLLTAWAG